MTTADPAPLLSWRSEQEWGRLARLVSFETGFWLGLVFSTDRSHTIAVRQRLASLLQGRARRLIVLEPGGPEPVVGRLFALTAGPGDCVWLDLSQPSDGDDRHWADVLATLNRRRDDLRRVLPSGLLVVLPASVSAELPFVALDLWSVRAVTVHLGRDQADLEVVLPAVREAPAEVAPASSRAPDRALTPAESWVIDLLRRARSAVSADPEEALRLACEAMAGVGADNPLRARALVVKGTAAAAIPDHAVAIESFQAALAGGAGLPHAERLEALVGAAAAASAIGRPAEAAEHLRRAIELQRRIDGRGSPEARTPWMAWALCELGDQCVEAGDLSGATAAHAESLTIRRRLADNCGTPQALRDLAVSLDKVGDGYHRTGDHTAATAAHTESLTIRAHVAGQAIKTAHAALDQAGPNGLAAALRLLQSARAVLAKRAAEENSSHRLKRRGAAPMEDDP